MPAENPQERQRIQFIEDNSCAVLVVAGVATAANILVIGYGAVLIYKNWERLFSDPIAGFLAVIFLYLFTRDMMK